MADTFHGWAALKANEALQPISFDPGLKLFFVKKVIKLLQKFDMI